MNFVLDTNNLNRAIQSYGEGYFKINGQLSRQHLFIDQNGIAVFEQPLTQDLLTEEQIRKIITAKPDILLIGTGTQTLFANKQLYGTMINHKIALEVMKTGAACRTHNVLVSEDRNFITVLYTE